METKTCNKCGEDKPLTNEFFQKRKTSKDGFRNECKECMKTLRKKYYNDNKEQIINKNTQYRKRNWDEHTKRRKEYEQKNKEILAEKRRRYNLENKEIVAKRKKEYAEKNKEKYSKYYLEYARKNRDKCKIKRHKREAKLKRLPSTLTKEQWDATFKHFDYSCAYCGSKEQIEQEHFVPLAKGGEFTHNNIIPACKSCNCSKQDRDFFEWYSKQDNYSKYREQKILQHLGYKNRIQQLSIL